LVLSTPALAQSITASPDHTGTVITIEGNQYNIHGGTQTGANLFHSFQDFGLSPGEVANFLSNPAIATIFGRVTGGNPSLIHGLIQVTGANSHLYLMNPAGIVFGQGASLNVGGDFVATTADRIGFAEGWFNASGANAYSTLIGAPHQFAFLSANPGAIINAGNLVTGQDLHLIGGTIANSGTIQGDRITLAAVPGNRWVNLAQAGMLLSLDVPQAALEAGITPLDLPSLLTAGAIADPIDPGSVTLNGRLTGTHIDLLASDRVYAPSPEQITGNLRVTRFTADGDNPTQALFIDARADNPEALLFGTAAGTVAQIIERDADGMAVIREQLADLSDAVGPLESVAIVAEGNQGNFWLGNQWITPETLNTYQTQLQAWSDSLTAGADLLLYSCFTALGATGEALIASLATLTGMDVAASLNATGSRNYGGDWTLETSTGPITASTPFTQTTLDQWDGKLALLTVTDFSDGGGANTLRNLIASAAAGDMVTFAIASTINLSSEVSWATDNLTIDGNGGTVTGTTSSRVFNISANNATVQNITIRDGTASGNGGGILHSGSGLLAVNNAVVTNNAAGRGGGIESTTGSLRVTNSQITQNSASGEGGGLWNDIGALTLTNTTVANNTAGDRGGGIRKQGGTVTLNSSTIAGNSSGSGGGGMFSNAGTATLNNTTVANNTANGIGGGLWRNGALTLTNSTVAGNITNSHSGGIFVNTGSLSLTNSTVSGNSAVGGGGGIRSNNAVVSLTNATIAFNTTSNNGGGLLITNPLGNAIANTIIANNTASLGSPDINADLSLSTVQASLITDPSGITGATLTDGVNGNIIGQDPLLGPLQNNGGATQTHALLAGSPAINTGENTPALPPTDQTGNPRIASGNVDIGAYEVPEDPVILPIAIAPPPPETPSVPPEEASLPVEELAEEPTEDFTTRAVRDGQSLLDTGVEEIEAGQTSAYQDFATVPPLTLKASQTILKQIAQATGTEPSLLYLTFTPVSLSQTPESPTLLASADPAMQISQSLQEPNPLDELQMVLVTSDGTPIVKHSVGVQRRDVVGMMRRLRRQLTSSPA
jgi:filamentous hemagglutinin family protein